VGVGAGLDICCRRTNNSRSLSHLSWWVLVQTVRTVVQKIADYLGYFFVAVGKEFPVFTGNTFVTVHTRREPDIRFHYSTSRDNVTMSYPNYHLN